MQSVKVLLKIKWYWAIFGILHIKYEVSIGTYTVVITGCKIKPVTREKIWWFKNSWGEELVDNGFGKLYKRFDTFHQKLVKNTLTLSLMLD